MVSFVKPVSWNAFLLFRLIICVFFFFCLFSLFYFYLLATAKLVFKNDEFFFFNCFIIVFIEYTLQASRRRHANSRVYFLPSLQQQRLFNSGYVCLLFPSFISVFFFYLFTFALNYTLTHVHTITSHMQPSNNNSLKKKPHNRL